MMMPRRRRNTAAQLILLCLLQHTACEAYTPSSSRRQFFIETASAIAVVSTVPPPAQAETSVYNRVQLGHARVRYLLDHWDDVTAVCGTTIMSDTERKQIVRTENGNFCTKTPLKVQDYMGYKSTTDPLYRIDKLLIQDSVTNKLDSDDFVEYLEAVEAFKETADQTAMLAYTSSWGEANPNGSKETVDAYLEQTKSFVMESEKQLRKILGYLHLEPLAPLQKAALTKTRSL